MSNTTTARRKAMNLRDYWDHVGTENIEAIVDRLGSSIGYFKLLRYGVKKPSARMALNIIEAAEKITPGSKPDLELLLKGVPKAGTSSPARKLPPSPSFVRSMRRREGRAMA